jgi:hypothetical protein
VLLCLKRFAHFESGENVLESFFTRRSSGAVAQFALSLLMAVSLIGGLGQRAAADDVSNGTPAAVEPAVVETPTPEPTPTLEPIPTDTAAASQDAPTAIPTDVPTETPTATATEADTATATATETATETATATPSPTPQPPALVAKAAVNPVCTPVEGQPATVASGASADYACTYQVALVGDRLAPSWIAIGWTLAAKISGGWSVQLLSSVPKAEWSSAGAPTATLQQTTGAAPEASVDVQDGYTSVATWAFRVRMTRAACNVQPAELTLDLTGVATLPGHDDATVESSSERTDRDPRFKISPALASIPEPVLNFAGPLSFGTVGVTAEGPASPVVTGSVDLTVSNLDLACGSWTVGLQAQALSGSNGVQIPANTLTLTSINGQPLDGGPCDLASGCQFATVQAGPGAAATVTLTLGVSLAVPDQSGVGTFGSTLSASVTRAQ